MTHESIAVEQIDAESFVERKESRVLQIYRVSVVEAGRQRGFCVVRNVSGGGAMIRTALRMATGEAIRLVLSSDLRIVGTVRWQNGGSAGIAFDTPMSVPAILARGDYEAPNRRSRRLPRLDIAVPVGIADASGSQIVTACDISTHGLRIARDRLLARGPLRITLPRFADIRAHLLWIRDGEAGCVFDTPLGVDALTRWVNATDGEDCRRAEPDSEPDGRDADRSDRP